IVRRARLGDLALAQPHGDHGDPATATRSVHAYLPRRDLGARLRAGRGRPGAPDSLPEPERGNAAGRRERRCAERGADHAGARLSGRYIGAGSDSRRRGTRDHIAADDWRPYIASARTPAGCARTTWGCPAHPRRYPTEYSRARPPRYGCECVARTTHAIGFGQAAGRDAAIGPATRYRRTQAQPDVEGGGRSPPAGGRTARTIADRVRPRRATTGPNGAGASGPTRDRAHPTAG